MKATRGLWVNVVLITTILVLGGVWLYYKYNSEHITERADSSQTKTQSDYISDNVNPSLDVSTWKIYRNQEYGFEFQYPSYLNINQLSNQGTSTKIKIAEFESSGSHDLYGPQLILEVARVDEADLKDLYHQPLPYLKSFTGYDESSSAFIFEALNMIPLGGERAGWKFSFGKYTGDKAHWDFLNYTFVRVGKEEVDSDGLTELLVLLWYSPESKNDGPDSEIQEKIAASFKFLKK